MPGTARSLDTKTIAIGAAALAVAWQMGLLPVGNEAATAAPLPLQEVRDAGVDSIDDGFRHYIVSIDDSASTIDGGDESLESAAATSSAETSAPTDAVVDGGIDPNLLAELTSRLASLTHDPDGVPVAVLTDGSRVRLDGSTASDPAPDARVAASGDVASEVGAVEDRPAAYSPHLSTPLPMAVAAMAADPAIRRIEPMGGGRWAIATSLTAEQVAAHEGVHEVADDLVLVPATDDPLWSSLWGLESTTTSVGGHPAAPDVDIDAPEAWSVADGGGVVVAVIDGGVQTDHPDLIGQIWTNDDEICGNDVDDDDNGYVDDCEGWDFFNDDATVYDEGDGVHGSHVAGTIAASAGNGVGVAGVAPGAEIMVLKAFQPAMRLSDGVRAIDYAIDNGARVINASFGTPAGTPHAAVALLEAAIERARDADVLFVAAAGNNGIDTDAQPVWPASLPTSNIVSVGASTATDAAAGFSNRGLTSVDLFAPGHYIVSTAPGSRYAALQGTSMAAPHVSGAAAVLWSNEPGITLRQVKDRLLATTDPVPALATLSASGGRLNLARALGLEPDGPPPVSAMFTGLSDLMEDTSIDAGVTVEVDDTEAIGSSPFVVRATLLAAKGDASYGVVEHPVAVDGAPGITDDFAQVFLGGSTDLATNPAFTAGGHSIAVATDLPAGDYAMVVELVSPDDPEDVRGNGSAAFFHVAALPSAEPELPIDTDPGPGGPGVDPGPGAPPVGDEPGGDPTPPTTVPDDPTTDHPASPGSPGGDGGTTPDPGSGGGGGGTTPGVPVTTTPPVGGGPSPTTTVVAPANPTPTTLRPPTAPTTAPPTTVGTVPAPDPGGSPTPGDGTSPTTAPVTIPSPTATTAPLTPPTTTAPAAPVTNDRITINRVSPNVGSTEGWEPIVVFGEGFPSHPMLLFGGRSAFITFHSRTQIAAMTPPHLPGAVDVEVRDHVDRKVVQRHGFTYVGPATGDPGDPGDPTPPTTSPSPGDGGGGTPTTLPGVTPEPEPPSTRLRLGAREVWPNGLVVRRVLANSPVAAHAPHSWAARACTSSPCAGTAV